MPPAYTRNVRLLSRKRVLNLSNQTPVADLISIIIPCHNEGTNIPSLYAELIRVTTGQPERFEFLFIDDGSRDATADRVRDLGATDPRVRLIELARNFGKEVAVTAGLHRAHGAAAITIDADLQHPTDLIPELISRWRDGHEVVIGVRRLDRNYASLIKRAGSYLFYRIMNLISEVEIVPRATDYRLLDRGVIEAFAAFTERNRITRGLIDWLGFRRAYVEFTPAKRHSGRTGYSFLKLYRLATNSVVSMSFLPLKLAGYLGVIIMLVSGPLGVFIFISKYIMNDPLHFSGTAALAVILIFLVGLILSSLGLMALYIAGIHTEVMNRPLYVVRPESRRHRAAGSRTTIPTPAATAVAVEADLPARARATDDRARAAAPAAAPDAAPTAERLRRRAAEQPAFGEVRGG
jgi:glycosyltransferase involved in cell wall biosynthesis